ncbi:MAG: AMP-binding protein [Gordonia sp. (in: high G+C Gram-positive bacteria)]
MTTVTPPAISSPAELFRQVRSSMVLAQANTVLFERPDRLPRALAAALPFGTGLLAALAASAARYPEVVAVTGPGESMTYRAMWRETDAQARGLRAEGISSSTKVGILHRNSPMFVRSLVAAAKLGADVVLLNTAMSGPQLDDVIVAESVTAVLGDDDLIALLPPRDGVTHVDTARLWDLAATGSPGRLKPPPREGRMVILTSGTTGTPKGAARSAGTNALDAAASVLASIPFRARDTIVIPSPFFHAWGLNGLLLGLGMSATIVTTPTFRAVDTLTQIDRYRADGLIVVPTMLQRICDTDPAVLAQFDTGTLRYLGSSGSAISPDLVTEVLDRFGPVLYNIYGSTEVALATVAGPADLRRFPTTAGRRVPGVGVMVLDDAGRPVPDGTVGRIFVANSFRFDGYTNGATKESAAGGLSSGDKGYFDPDGRLFIVGREDDMIVSGGENIYPLEVENLLVADERIVEAAVVGIPHESFGQVLKAIIVVADGHELTTDDVRDLVASRLARYKVPKVIEFTDALPRTATGKLLRRKMI